MRLLILVTTLLLVGCATGSFVSSDVIMDATTVDGFSVKIKRSISAKTESDTERAGSLQTKEIKIEPVLIPGTNLVGWRVSTGQMSASGGGFKVSPILTKILQWPIWAGSALIGVGVMLIVFKPLRMFKLGAGISAGGAAIAGFAFFLGEYSFILLIVAGLLLLVALGAIVWKMYISYKANVELVKSVEIISEFDKSPIPNTQLESVLETVLESQQSPTTKQLVKDIEGDLEK